MRKSGKQRRGAGAEAAILKEKNKADEKRRVYVGCALIVRGKELLIAQRKPGSNLAGCWEFPGGKREKDETLEDCLIREVWEELGVCIRPRKLIRQEVHEMPDRFLDLYFYVCDWVSGKPVKKDCQDFRWVLPEELVKFTFPPADGALIQELIKKKKFYLGRSVFF